MLNATNLVEAFGRNVMLVKMQTAGISQAESLVAIPSGSNCLNWVLGHLAISRDDVLEALGQPALGIPGGERYKRGSEPVSATSADALDIEVLLGWFERGQEQIAAALGDLDDAALACPIKRGDRTMTLGERIFFLYFHETYHVGQTEIFRQLSGRNDKLI